MPDGTRRLAAIMFTDMVGYTTLGQRDESLSLALVEDQRKLIRPILNRHDGREVKTMGDAFLVQFASALNAVRCAYDIQRSAREYNISLPEERRVHLRIGVHLGDVIESQGDVSGDAVNVASRIEHLAEDGGVCLTRQVYDHVQNKIQLPLKSLGLRSLKNVNAPVEVYKMGMPWEEEKDARTEQLDRRRIAVLPFSNMSPDPADEYFADGLTEELISRLSLVKGLRVIARTSVMNYKKKEKRIFEIGKELGVGSVVEGSVRKAGNKIRVTAQLIDAGTEEHLWASTYDKNLDDIFLVQSDVASKIAETLPGSLTPPKISQTTAGDTTNITAYSHYLKGKQLLNEGTDESLRRALELFTNATKLAPSFARAHVAIGQCYAQLSIRSYISYDEGVSGMRSAAKKALEDDENLAEGHSLLAFVAWVEDDFSRDELEARRAIELNPSLAEAYQMLALIRASKGYLRESVELIERASLLDPLSSDIISYLGLWYFYSGRDQDALDLWNRNRKFAPVVVARSVARYYLAKNNVNRAEEQVELLESLAPADSSTILYRGLLLAMKGDAKGAEKIIEKLQREFQGGEKILERNIGYIRFVLGDMDAFFSAMFHAVENHVFDPAQIRYSPLFQRAREDPRYRELLLKNGLDPDLRE